MKFLFFFVLICGYIQINNTLEITSPKHLKQKSISFIPASFGNYFLSGHQCEYLKAKKYEGDPYSCTEIAPGTYHLDEVVFVKRGGENCTFARKARTIEHGGAKNLIVVDYDETENTQLKVMTDDGTGNSIRVRVVMISQSDGNRILNHLEKYPEIDIWIKFGYCLEFDYYR